MDALSVIVSTIQIAGVVRTAIRKIQEIRHAQPQIHALANEVSDLTIILLELEKCLSTGHSSQNPQFLQALHSIRTKLNGLAEKIIGWVDGFALAPESQEIKRLRWLRVAGKAKAFRDELHSLRSELGTVLSVVTTSTSSRIEVDLQQIYLVSGNVAAEQRKLQSEIQTASKAQLAEIRQLNATMSTLQSGTATAAIVQSQNSSLGKIDAGIPTSDEPPVVGKNTIRAFPHNGSILFDSEKMSAVTAVGIRTAHFSRSACTPWCACRCHKQRHWQTPSSFGGLLGSLFVGYSGLPIIRLQCDERSCKLRSQPMVYVSYFFPPWFLARAMSMVMASTPLAGPVVSLKMQRTIPGDSDIFTFARLGEVEKMKALFENGLASPHDVHYESGITPLHIAISNQQVNVCRFLLQANADPFLEDRAHWTAADNAWAKIFSKSFPKEIETELHEMFSDTEYLERREFTMLQRIVLGLVGKDLKKELEASTKEINTRDSNGRTALFMAAERNDLPVVNLLLEYGADPNIICPDQGSPLHFAAIARGSCCIAPLLRDGANIEAMTSWRQTALHYVAAYKNDERPTKMLLEAGANTNSRDLDGITPLQWAVVSNGEKVVEVLLGSGADINNVDNSNNTAVRSAITASRHTILNMLVDHGFSLEVPWFRDGTLLHELANSADLQTMEIMQRVNLSHVPIDRLDSKGLTAFEVLQSREDLSAEITGAFARLVKSQALVPEPRPQDSSTSISKPSEIEVTSASGSNDDPPAEEGLDVVSDQHSKQGRNTESALKRAAWVENAGKLVRGTATNIKLQRDVLCVVLLAYVIALFCRSLWRVSR